MKRYWWFLRTDEDETISVGVGTTAWLRSLDWSKTPSTWRVTNTVYRSQREWLPA